MKQAIIGLVALVAGCATASAMPGAESQSEQLPPIQNVVWGPGGTPVGYGAIPEAAPIPAENVANNYEPRGTGLAEAFAPVCQGEPRIFVEPHSYTIECNGYTFIHFQHSGAHDVYGNMILEPGCENTLVSRELVFGNTVFKYVDEDCDGTLNLYEAWHEEHGEQIMDGRTTNPSASLQSTYDVLYNGLGAQETESLWMQWYGVQSQSW